MANFKLVGYASGNDHGVTEEVVIKNSTQLTVGDPVNVNTDGFADLATSSERIAGVVTGFVLNNGLPTTSTTGQPDATTVTAGSSNQTTTKTKVQIETSKAAKYKLEASGTLGTTTGSNLKGVYLNITGATGAVKANEATVAGGGSSAGGTQLYSYGPDETDSTTHVIVSLRQMEQED